jgi:hypothetical protein
LLFDDRSILCARADLPLLQDTPEAQKFVDKIIEMLKSGKTYGDRRGCAYGLAGITKGLGIGSLKQLGIMANIQVGRQGSKGRAEIVRE